MNRKIEYQEYLQGNREHKSTLFCKAFEEKKHLLDLYNSVNDSNYQNPEDLEVNTLEEYAIFVSKVREHTTKTPKNLSEAIERAVDECIEEGILADILSNQKAEVLELALTTFDRELYEQGLREEGEAIGEARGEARGKAKGEEKLSELITILLDAGLDDVVRIVTSDKVAREEYYKKYNIK